MLQPVALKPMTLDTQMTLALLQELLLALRANDVEGFKGWHALGLEELGRQVVIELMKDWMSRTGLSYSIPIKHSLAILITRSELR
jgi:hypothetical protein